MGVLESSSFLKVNIAESQSSKQNSISLSNRQAVELFDSQVLLLFLEASDSLVHKREGPLNIEGDSFSHFVGIDLILA